MDNRTAKYLGLEKALYIKEYSAEKIINLVSTYFVDIYNRLPSDLARLTMASRENASRKFLDPINGAELP
ncbi:hypothetical protein HD806DRAFT_480243 [Xylariaceae sp. AK1471]|nr:hypothetical protein HD806DRAFT_480243 [Xylariaceae sp. AK1471]